MNFPVFTQLAGNFRFSETGSLETASSSEESAANLVRARRCAWARATAVRVAASPVLRGGRVGQCTHTLRIGIAGAVEGGL